MRSDCSLESTWRVGSVGLFGTDGCGFDEIEKKSRTCWE